MIYKCKFRSGDEQKKNKTNKTKQNKKQKQKQKQKQKNTTQKTHRPYNSLDLTDPNFATFGRIYNFARIIKKSAISDFKQNLLIWFEFL